MSSWQEGGEGKNRGKLNVWHPQNWSVQHFLTLGEQLVVVPGYKKEEQLCKLSFQGGIFVCVLKAWTKKDLKSFRRHLLRHGKSVMFLKPGRERAVGVGERVGQREWASSSHPKILQQVGNV